MEIDVDKGQESLAIIGMSLRLPGANNKDELWDNLINGKESIKIFTPHELINESGFDSSLIENKNYIPAKGYLSETELFATGFFGFSKLKASITNPQFRILIECVWEALEDAGFNIDTYLGKVGVYATSSSKNSYYEKNILCNKDILEKVSEYELFMRNANDFLATTIAYQFNFKGPCINIQTACSSALVAICKACEDLRYGNCDVAVVAGVSIKFPIKSGYLYKDGMIYSSDGHCRVFSKSSTGVVPGDGGGVIILKRLSSAEIDRDHIYAIIKGVSVNNDGNEKLGYTAPSISGQLEVLRQASENAQISPETISYIEAHGTGTKLGDEIELTALKEYLISNKKRDIPCYIGAIKPNIGHLDVAAGIAGFIKTVLSINKKIIPKTIHSEPEDNRSESFNESMRLTVDNVPWTHNKKYPRRAGVSSFGIGGTNSHVIVEEYNKKQGKHSNYLTQIVLISAKNKNDLSKNKEQLMKYLINTQDSLSEIAVTMQHGRQHFKEREAIICESKKELIDIIYFSDMQNILYETLAAESNKKIFLFPKSEDMNVNFYMKKIKSDKAIRDIWDKYDKMMLDVCSCQIDSFLNWRFNETEYSREFVNNILSFICQIIIADYWVTFGITPDVVFGVGVGEYAAAYIAGILSFKDIFRLIKFENKDKKEYILAMSDCKSLQNIFCNRAIEIVSIETKNKTILAIELNKLKEAEETLIKKEIVFQKVKCKDMFLLSKLSPECMDLLGSIKLEKGNIENITSRTDYSNNLNWKDSLNNLNNTYKACKKLLDVKEAVYIDISFGNSLSSQLQQINFQLNDKAVKTINIKKFSNKKPDVLLQMMLAKAWTFGLNINWETYSTYYNQTIFKVSMPGYFLEREECSFRSENKSIDEIYEKTSSENVVNKRVRNYLYCPIWMERPILHVKKLYESQILVSGSRDKTSEINYYLKNTLGMRHVFEFFSDEDVDISIVTEKDFEERMVYWRDILSLHSDHRNITILYAHSLNFSNERFGQNDMSYYYDLISLGRAIGISSRNIHLNVIVLTRNTLPVILSDIIRPIKSSILGPILCLPEEYSNLKTKLVDLTSETETKIWLDYLAKELFAEDTHKVIAYRDKKRYAKYYLNHKVNSFENENSLKFKRFGVYIIIGGLGGIGIEVASYLAKRCKANIVLLSRTREKEVYVREHIAEIKEHANSLQIYEANISDYNSILKIIENIEFSIGKIDGVIHAAGIYPSGLIQHKKFSEHQNMFEAKISGLLVLDDIFKDKSLDFMILFSSLSSVRGAVGAVDYIAANNFINSYSEVSNGKRKFPIISIGWDAWKEIGMRKNYLAEKSKNKLLTHSYNLLDELWKKFILEHKYIDGKLIVPATVIIEMLCHLKCLEKEPIIFENIFFTSPGIVTDLKLSSIQIKSNREMTQHKIYLNTDGNSVCIASAVMRKSSLSKNDFKRKFSRDYEPEGENRRFSRGDRKIKTGEHWWCDVLSKKVDDEYFSQIALPEKFFHEVDEYILHPSLFDVAINTHIYGYKEQYFPFLIEGLRIYSKLEKICFSNVKVKYEGKLDGLLKSSAILTDKAENILVEIDNFILKRDL